MTRAERPIALLALSLGVYDESVALGSAAGACAQRCIPVHDFGRDARWLDWTFGPDSAVWTAKGPRKFENPAYLAELSRWCGPGDDLV